MGIPVAASVLELFWPPALPEVVPNITHVQPSCCESGTSNAAEKWHSEGTNARRIVRCERQRIWVFVALLY